MVLTQAQTTAFFEHDDQMAFSHSCYKKSIAEQISMEQFWDMLMGQEYAELRACIYQTEEELRRFRQLVVNTVMATDIADKELQTLRKKRCLLINHIIIGK
eukprot:scaffold25685_cov127-Cylindrotheca_fusiformis.AAC.9